MSSTRERPQRIAGKLLAIRQHLGVSQTGMKRLLNYPGPYGRISEWELGKRQPPMTIVLAYARAASVQMEQIVDDELELEI